MHAQSTLDTDSLVDVKSGAVVQRDADGVGWLRLSPGSGDNCRALRSGGDEIVGWVDGTRPLGLPTGGPYDIEVGGEDDGEVVATDVYVGDLWVLAGQSNMVGCGRATSQLPEPHRAVRALGLDDVWTVASEPLVARDDAADGYLANIDPNATDFSPQQRSALAASWMPRQHGLATTFGRTLYDASDVPVGLIPTAVGASSLAEWLPGDDERAAGPHYSAMLHKVHLAGRIRGVLWYQGESDANQTDGCAYSAATKELVQGFRRDLPAYASRLEVFVVQLCRVAGPGVSAIDRTWSLVRDAQRDVKGLDVDGMASAIDLQLDDIVHVDTEGLVRLGRRLARLATRQSRTLDVANVKLTESGTEVEVVYEGVTGSLSPQRNIAGFSVLDGTRTVVPIIHWTGVDDDRGHVVLLRLTRPPRPGEALCYGWGANPVCNLVDGADMAAPGFGPMPLVGNSTIATGQSVRVEREPDFTSNPSARSRADREGSNDV